MRKREVITTYICDFCNKKCNPVKSLTKHISLNSLSMTTIDVTLPVYISAPSGDLYICSNCLKEYLSGMKFNLLKEVNRNGSI